MYHIIKPLYKGGKFLNIDNIKLIAIFFEGVLSFFSPCIIPLIPIYLSLLAGKKEMDAAGNLKTNKKIMYINSLFFIIGICCTFFLLAYTTSYISHLLNSNIHIIQTISGCLIIFMGLLQIGIIKLSILKREFSFKNKVKRKDVTPIISFLMGFTFSFSWTPCIGPILASIFLYASSNSGVLSSLLIIIYSIGFILPFIIITFFATSTLMLFKKHPKILKYTVIISGVILILIGISILTGSFQQISLKYFI